jgi:hypothetical protein
LTGWWLAELTLWLKSPFRSSAVGTVTLCAVFGTSCSCHSSLQKKNTLLRMFHFRIGMGPPMV